MSNRAAWMRGLLMALMVAGQAWSATLTPIALPGVADTVIALADGTLIFNDTAGDNMSRYDPATGEATAINLGVAQVSNTVLGADGRLWFTVDSARQVGRYSFATGLLDRFTLPDSVSGRFGGIVLGLDGNLWATASDVNRIVRISPTGVISTFDLPSFQPYPAGIAQGPDGNMWFAEQYAKKIGRITPSGGVTEFTVPPALATGPRAIVRGNDGAMWFATDDGYGRVAMNGEMQLFHTGAQNAGGRMVAAPDGSFWLATADDSIAQFDPPSGLARLVVFPGTAGAAQSAGMLFDAGGNLYVTDASLRHTGRAVRVERAAASTGDATVVEFYNNTLQHYFITADVAEAAGIDGGAAGPGWVRTGESWKAWLAGPPPGATEVCRFYGNPAPSPADGRRIGPNSHFYTFQGPECEQVKKDPGWVFEGPNRFFMLEPGAGATCPTGTQEVWRAYNNGYTRNDSNHRYTVKKTTYDQMVAAGWRGEGVVMCTAP